MNEPKLSNFFQIFIRFVIKYDRRINSEKLKSIHFNEHLKEYINDKTIEIFIYSFQQ
jgi:hypothetical protein